jgi:hypothetical protein
MKQFLPIAIFLVAALSCKREKVADDVYIDTVKKELIDSVSEKVYSRLNFDQAFLSRVDSVGLFILRIPFKGSAMDKDFIVLRTDLKGRISEGRLIHLDGKDIEVGQGRIKRRTFEGTITISSLKEMTLINSEIVEGYVKAFHKKQFATRTGSMQAPDVLPEVVIVTYVNNVGVSYSDWIALQSFFRSDGNGDYTSGNYYGAVGGGGGGIGGGDGIGGNNKESGFFTSPTIQVDVETFVNNPAIDLAAYLKCFENIPDFGATCSIEIFSDIPVDSDPNKLFDLSTQSPGHTFLQLKKSNNDQHALQSIGFYPKTNWQSIITTAPVEGKFVDNGGHEFNASFKMNLSPQEFQSVVTEIKYLARSIMYDIDEYNCTDFSLDVFNKVRTKKLEIPMYDIPGGLAAAGTRTPQGLYHKLKEMKDQGDPESMNINIGFSKGWVAYSDGPCN